MFLGCSCSFIHGIILKISLLNIEILTKSTKSNEKEW
ncbi:MAG: hypothetical protein ACJA17_000615 [Polaribacter sp.]